MLEIRAPRTLETSPLFLTQASMSGQWYCSIGQQQYGPLPFEQLQQWAADGRLQPDHHVCLVGQPQWTIARDVPGLFGPVAAPGFNFEAPGASSTTSRSSGSRTSGRSKKNDLQTFKWGSAILAGVLATAAGVGRLMTLNDNRQQAIQQRQQEQRRQQKINTPPKLPPITGPKIDMEDIQREIKKSRTPPRPQETPQIPRFGN